MIDAATLPPVPVAGPLLVAGLLLVFSKVLPRHAPDVIAILTALAAAGLCAIMTAHAAHGPITYWFGGWTPRNGQAIGIDFAVDQAGGAFATVIAVLFVATLIFAWGFFDEVHAHFHVLSMLFMAGMIGFCLTHDIFNMFVWFEVMSVAAFALTGYELTSAPLSGALNFTVMNTIGSYLLLGGIGLMYALGGALDMGALGATVLHAPANPLVGAAFVLMSTGFLIKGAQVPYHFWLPDAHAVAPSPVSVLFSGAMVALGIFGVARITFSVFAASAAVLHIVHGLLFYMGVASAVLGAAMALLQRHLKRLLAFSTVSHVGVMLIGLALLRPGGTAGMLMYIAGHGLVKGALFMVAGIVMASLGGIDELGLRGRGARIWPAGIAMAAGGLLLAGLPLGPMDHGLAAIEDAAGPGWLWLAILFCNAGTGAAVLRAAGRIFVGWGPTPGEEDRSPTDEEAETANRPLWLMLAPTAALLILGCLTFGIDAFANSAASQMMPASAATPAPPGPDIAPETLAWASVALALLLAAYDLSRHRLPNAVNGAVQRVLNPVANVLGNLHSGAVGDYVAWLVAGLALFTIAFALS